MAKSKIIKELANNQISMEVALQRLMVIASDLDNDELLKWTELELHGYKKVNTLPSYRKTKSLHFTYSGINGSFQITNSQFTWLEIIAEHDKNAFEVPIMDSVSTLESFIDNYQTQSYCRDYTYLSGEVYERTGIQCTSIMQRVPLNFLQNIMSQIKTILINIFLKLDKEYGCLDQLDVDTTAKTPDEVAEINKVVNNYIFVDNSIHVGDKNKIKGTDFK